MFEPKEQKQLREVRVIDLFSYFVLPLLILIGIWVAFTLIIVLDLIDMKIIWLVLIAIGASYIPLRYFAIGCILMYKAFAPMETRNRCLYQPTCSTYMIIAIKKYGLILGVTLGLVRIKSCVPPNGGYDYPSLKKLFNRNKNY